MTQPPILSDLSPATSQPPTPAARPRLMKRQRLLIGAAVIASLAAGGGAVAVGLSLAPTQPGSIAAANEPTSWVHTQDPVLATTEASPEPTSGPTPAASDFALTPKITKKQCFGSAGCSIEFRIEMGYGGPTLSDDDTWLITYEVRGVEDGPMINQLEVTGDTFTSENAFADLEHKGDTLKVVVTDVDKDGI